MTYFVCLSLLLFQLDDAKLGTIFVTTKYKTLRIVNENSKRGVTNLLSMRKKLYQLGQICAGAKGAKIGQNRLID